MISFLILSILLRLCFSTNTSLEDLSYVKYLEDSLLISTPSEESEKSSNIILISTNKGDVLGTSLNIFNTTIHQFLGIPYARPPVGSYRFQKAQQVAWKKPLKAFSYSPMCLQWLPEGFTDFNELEKLSISEDCLYLNIWSPRNNSNSLKPVMVWFHPGTFSLGSASLERTRGDIISAIGDVVVVSFNYRLNIFGFLNLGIPEAPGNMGLSDQKMALEWIKENIAAFGGDPDLITPFGSGSGAISIGIHLYQSNMFMRAIMQSGSPTNFRFLYENYEDVANKLLEELGCQHRLNNYTEKEINATKTLNCLNEQPFRNIKEAVNIILKDFPFAFYPSIKEDEILPFDSFFDIENYKNTKQLLTGFNKDEGTLFLQYSFPEYFQKGELNLISDQQIGKMLDLLLKNKWPLPKKLEEEVRKYFLNYRDTIQETYLSDISKIFSDNMIVCPILSYSELFSGLQDHKVYVYNFTQRSSASSNNKWFGVNHLHEIPFVFGLPLRGKEKYSQAEKEFSKRIIKTWTHFAKTGNVPDQLGVKWPEFDDQNLQYMELNSQKARTGQSYSKISTKQDESCNLFKFILELGADVLVR